MANVFDVLRTGGNVLTAAANAAKAQPMTTVPVVRRTASGAEYSPRPEYANQPQSSTGKLFGISIPVLIGVGVVAYFLLRKKK